MTIQRIIAITLLALLCGCAHIYGKNGFMHNRETDYLQAQNIAPLKIPAGYSSDTMQTLYPVSEKTYTANQTQVNLTPPDLQ